MHAAVGAAAGVAPPGFDHAATAGSVSSRCSIRWLPANPVRAGDEWGCHDGCGAGGLIRSGVPYWAW